MPNWNKAPAPVVTTVHVTAHRLATAAALTAHLLATAAALTAHLLATAAAPTADTAAFVDLCKSLIFKA